MKMNLIYTLCLTFALLAAPVFAQQASTDKGKATVSGHLKDKSTGEDLLGATIYVREISTGTTTNQYGFYSISLAKKTYTLVFSYVGYGSQEKVVNLTGPVTLNVDLVPRQQLLEEVIIRGEGIKDNISKVEMSAIKMDVKTIQKIPALMGEVDIIKAIQLLPGVQSVSEGGSGFSVRGGGLDQNLILLDEAPVYNASHLMGFFSVFNNDAIKDVKLYKGDIPASAGGRLSSLLDVRMKDGNTKKLSGTGGIGTISSRFTFEGPLQKDKASFIVSGRRTYADLFLKLSSNEDLRDNILYFYDLNAKVNYEPDNNNRIFISAYYGKDVFKNSWFGMYWGNQTFTARWNHLFSKKLFSNFTLIQSDFDYQLGVPEGSPDSFTWTARLRDYGAKADFNYFLNSDNTLRFGISSSFHQFSPGKARGIGGETFFDVYEMQKNNALESALYLSNEQKIGARLTLKYGVRFSHFVNIGYTYIYNFTYQYEKIDSTVYEKGVWFSPYSNLEPRLGFNYILDEKSSLKGSYSRTVQYIHLAQNSTAGTPLDIWFPSSPNVKPQTADQFAVGYLRNFYKNRIEASVEGYYKFIDHAIDFKDHAYLLLNREFEGELRFGTAWSYGLEVMLRLAETKLNGWISYTLSKTERKVKEINNNKAYVAPYDKPHNISVVLNYDLSPRVTLSGNWVYSTGQPVTFPTGRYEYMGEIVPVYSDRNAYRLPDYHRLDLSVILRGKEKEGRKWHGEWNFSVYNAYARHNTWVVNFKQEKDDPNKTYAEKMYLFGIVPSITYNFHF
jgi:hypothetical protein